MCVTHWARVRRRGSATICRDRITVKIETHGATRDHCRNGHELSAENTILKIDGYRACRKCKAASCLRNKKSHRARMARSRAKFPEEYRARTAVARALKKGILKKSSECQICGRQGRLHGHHGNYLKPLEVLWLCPWCHAKEHGLVRAKL